jgi:microcystin-dependent protein
MSSAYVAEIRLFGGTFAPVGWMLCEGQLLSIADFETLFQLIGTTYGGDGETTFALPDLRGRVPVQGGNAAASGDDGSTAMLGEVVAGDGLAALAVNFIICHSGLFPPQG